MPAFSSSNIFPRNPGGHIVLPRDNVLDVCFADVCVWVGTSLYPSAWEHTHCPAGACPQPDPRLYQRQKYKIFGSFTLTNFPNWYHVLIFFVSLHSKFQRDAGDHSDSNSSDCLLPKDQRWALGWKNLLIRIDETEEFISADLPKAGCFFYDSSGIGSQGVKFFGWGAGVHLPELLVQFYLNQFSQLISQKAGVGVPRLVRRRQWFPKGIPYRLRL